MICKHILLIIFLNKLDLILLTPVKLLHVWLSNMNNSIYS